MGIQLSRLKSAVSALAAWLWLAAAISAAGQEPPAPPKPGPEHALLKKMEGTWDAAIKMSLEPGQPPKESKATARWKMECGGLWLVGDFRGEFGGQPFQGKSLDTYDPAKKKYVGIWVDSMATLPMLSEGAFDKEQDALTMTADYPGPDGKVAKHKMVSRFKDSDTILWTMSTVGKDGKDVVVMTITYTRKK